MESIEDVDFIDFMKNEIKSTILKDVNIQLYGIEEDQKMEGKLVYEVASNYYNPLSTILDLNRVFSFLRIRLQMNINEGEQNSKRSRLLA